MRDAADDDTVPTDGVPPSQSVGAVDSPLAGHPSDPPPPPPPRPPPRPRPRRPPGPRQRIDPRWVRRASSSSLLGLGEPPFSPYVMTAGGGGVTEDSSWIPLGAIREGTAEMTGTDETEPPTGTPSPPTTTTTAAAAFVSRHHRKAVGPTHDLWANEILSILLPTHHLMHWIKFLFVTLLLVMGCTLSVLYSDYHNDDGSSISSSNGIDNDNDLSQFPAMVGKFHSATYRFLSTFHLLQEPWVYLIALSLWMYWYYHLTLFATFAKVWMDPRIQATTNRRPMHVPLRLFIDPQQARKAACRPELVCRHPQRPRRRPRPSGNRNRFPSYDTTDTTDTDDVDDMVVIADDDVAGNTVDTTPTTPTLHDAGDDPSPTPNIWLLDPLDWQFQLHSTVEEALTVVYQDYASVGGGHQDDHHHSTSTSTWGPIVVPGHWMLQHPYKLRDGPIYTNQKYPFPCRPPIVPVSNPTGVYKLRLDRWPSDWPVDDQPSTQQQSHRDDHNDDDNDDDDGEYSILLHGIESACWVFWNGTLLGYFQDSRLPSEFVIPKELLFLHRLHQQDGLVPADGTATGTGGGVGGGAITSTAGIKRDGPVLHIVVARWSDGSYMEDQDHWWMAGIHRSVEIVRRPKRADMMDYHVLALADGTMTISVSLRGRPTQQPVAANTTMPRQRVIRARLYQDRQLNADGDCELAENEVWCQTKAVETNDTTIVTFRDTLANIEPWTAETPNLYTLLLEQVVESGSDGDGGGLVERVVQCESCRVGFRTVEINADKGGILQINGRPITVCGINRHEHDPDHGKVISLERMKQDIVILKQNNFNAVRTSHYPTHSSFYRLCDYYGMYVCDEANIETHGMKPMGRLAHDAGWESAFVSRVTRMVQRDWNHPCIIMWSLGNEAGRGRNLMKARKALMQLDTSRPICYESGGSWAEGIGRTELTDIVCPMYPSVPRMTALGQRTDEDRPIVLCEYSHSMNNSNGNIHLYWEKFWDPSLPRLQGGFIWDMIDQGLRKTTKQGRHYFGYGGDFGDVVNDRQFCINGMFSPDREPHPAVTEIKYLQQPVYISTRSPESRLLLLVSDDGPEKATLVDAADDNRATYLEVHNRYTFQTLEHLSWRWQLVCNLSVYPLISGNATNKGDKLNLDLSPAVSNIREMERKMGGASYFLNVQGVLHSNSSWADSGHVVIAEQFPLQVKLSGSVPPSDTELPAFLSQEFLPLKVSNVHDVISISNGDSPPFCQISTITGGIMTLNWGSDNFLCGHGIRPSYTRATTDNDRGGLELVLEHMALTWTKPLFLAFDHTKEFSHYFHWKNFGLTQDEPPQSVCIGAKVDQHEDVVGIIAECCIKTQRGIVLMEQTICYEIYRDGRIKMSTRISPSRKLRNIPSLPRVGFSLELDPSLYNVEYFGRGPLENYPDRKAGSQFGVWRTSPSEMGYDYIVPSENGSRSDCQWISFESRDKGRCGVAVVTSKGTTFSCSALLHDGMELNNSLHTHDRDVRKNGTHPIHVNIDHKLMGVAGDVSWFPCVYEPYCVKATEYEYSLWLVPIRPKDEPAILAHKVQQLDVPVS